jgi:hypothetical protein
VQVTAEKPTQNDIQIAYARMIDPEVDPDVLDPATARHDYRDRDEPPRDFNRGGVADRAAVGGRRRAGETQNDDQSDGRASALHLAPPGRSSPDGGVRRMIPG